MSDPIFLKIPTNRIRPNPTQPRSIFLPGAVEAMKVSLLAVGQQTAAKVRSLNEAEKAQDPDHDYELIGGHIRHAGALAAKIDTLDCLVYNLAPEQVELAGLIDNQSTEMHWLDWVIAIEKLYKAQTEPSQRKLADQLGRSVTRINFSLKLAKTLNQASRALIVYDVNTSGPENAVLERPVIALADLDDPKLVEQALPILIDRKLTEAQVKRLVKWVQAGNPVDAFVESTQPKTVKTKIAAVPALENAPATPATIHHASNTPTATPTTTNGTMSETETLAWDATVGISIISRIKAKVKKGERPSFLEALLLAGHYIWRGFEWLGKHGFKLIWHILKLFGKLLKDSFKSTAKIFGRKVYGFLQAVVAIAFICLAVWFVWDVYHHGPLHPIRVIASKIMLANANANVPAIIPLPTIIPTQVPQVPTPQPTQVKPISKAEDKPTAPTSDVVAAQSQATPTAVKTKTDIARDVIKQAAPAGVDVAKKLFGL